MRQIDADGEKDKQTHAVVGAAWEGEAPAEPSIIGSPGGSPSTEFRGPRLDYRRLVFKLRPSVPSADCSINPRQFEA